MALSGLLYHPNPIETTNMFCKQDVQRWCEALTGASTTGVESTGDNNVPSWHQVAGGVALHRQREFHGIQLEL